MYSLSGSSSGEGIFFAMIWVIIGGVMIESFRYTCRVAENEGHFRFAQSNKEKCIVKKV